MYERIQIVCLPTKKPPEFKNAFKIPPPKNHWIKIANILGRATDNSYMQFNDGTWQERQPGAGIIPLLNKPTFAWWFYEQEL